MSAATLYEQLPVSTDASTANGFQADSVARLLNADDYSTGTVKLEKISWWGAAVTEATTMPSLTNFEVRILNNLVDPPSSFAALSGSLSVTHLDDYFGDIDLDQINELVSTDFFEFTLNTPLSLNGINYLAIQYLGADPNWFWLFGQPGNGITAYYDGSWNVDSSSNVDLAFRLEGETVQNVPEPNVLSLFLLGLTMMPFGWGRRIS